MTVKKRFILIIALFALMAFITMPVSAWSVLDTYTHPNGGSSGPAGNTIQSMTVTAGTLQNVTKITWVGKGTHCYYGGGSPCKIESESISLKTGGCGGTTIGSAVFSYQINDGVTCDSHDLNTYPVTFELSDISVSSYPSGGISLCYGTSTIEEVRKSFVTNMTHNIGNNDVVNRGFLVASGWLSDGDYATYSGSNVVTPEASFTCTPTSQYPDEDIVCTDTSTNTPTSWLWSIDAEAMGIKGYQTHTGQNFTWSSHYPGFYSVNLQATNQAGSDWENKTNYVSISANATPNNCAVEPLPGYIRTYAQTNDGKTSGGIFDSDIQMQDIEGGAWSNITSSGGYWCIDTLPGHKLNLYAQATGYTSTETLNVPANGGRYYLVLWPDYIPTPSAGNITVYALVYDQQTGSPLYLSSVRIDGNSINTVVKNTGPDGQAMFTIKNDTPIHITASKTGYSTITKVLTTSHFGPDTVMISLPRSSVTATATPTPTPSWMTVQPTIDTRSNAQKDADLMDQIRNSASDLVNLAILATIFGLVGLIGRSMK